MCRHSIATWRSFCIRGRCLAPVHSNAVCATERLLVLRRLTTLIMQADSTPKRPCCLVGAGAATRCCCGGSAYPGRSCPRVHLCIRVLQQPCLRAAILYEKNCFQAREAAGSGRCRGPAPLCCHWQDQPWGGARCGDTDNSTTLLDRCVVLSIVEMSQLEAVPAYMCIVAQ